jgi:hypothetical protein
MSHKTRLANKTIWTLEDIIAASAVARRAWRRAHSRAKRRMDPIMLAALGDVGHQLAEIESLARDGRQGKYRGKPIDEEGA